MHEINPVLAGTYCAPDYVGATRNFNTPSATPATTDVTGAADTSSIQSTSNTSDIDPRRYTKFDRSATEAGSADLSFGDFLDMVNPLQHIPVVSSIYRAVTGATINPVSRVAGDALYGGAFGVASAMIGGLGAIGNDMVEAQTGKDVSTNVVAALFGSDDTSSSTQLASTTTPSLAPSTAASSVAALSSAPVSPVTQTPSQSTVSPTLAAATSSPTTVASTAPSGFPINTKLPYGGVMDTSKSIEAQNTAIALSESSHSMRLGNTIYTGRLMNGPHPLSLSPAPTSSTNPAIQTAPTVQASLGSSLPATAVSTQTQSVLPTSSVATLQSLPTAQTQALNPAQTSPAASSQAPVAVAAASVSDDTSSTSKNPLPQALIDDVVILKALNQYKGIASGTAALGSNLDQTN